MLTGLERAKGIADITAGIAAEAVIDGKVVGAIAAQSLRGPLLATVTSGHLPAGDNQVALGATTLRELGKQVGSLVRVALPVSGSERISTFQVVGKVVFSSDFTTGGLGNGAAFTLDGALRVAGHSCIPGPHHDACVVKAVISAGGAFLVRATPGASGHAALTGLNRKYAYDVNFPAPPTNLVNFGEAVNFPLIFGAILIVFGAATLLHVLVVSVARRRREMGLLKALGFVRRQVAFSVWWQTTTVALVGIVIGVPLGIALGRTIWGAFANSLGVLAVTVVLTWAIVAVALGTVVIANLLAIGPAWMASRSHPASLLSAE
jgi:ABC-type lipoprotein release transport system permease subunit